MRASLSYRRVTRVTRGRWVGDERIPMSRLLRVLALLVRARPGLLALAGLAAPAIGPRGAPGGVPRRDRPPPDVPRLRQPPAAGRVPARQRARGSPRCPTAPVKRRNERLLRRVRLPLDPERDQHRRPAADVGLRAPGRLPREQVGQPSSAATTARTSSTVLDGTPGVRGVHRQHLLPRAPAPTERQRTGQSQPDRAVLRRPAALSRTTST